MPHLSILNQKSIFAGDDIGIPVSLGGLFRIIEIVLSLPILIYVTTRPSSTTTEDIYYETISECIRNELDDPIQANAILNGHELTVAYAATSFIVAFIGLIEYISMYCVARIGNPTHTNPRQKYMTTMCNINLSLTYALRVGTFIFGIFMASIYIDYCDCQPPPTTTIDEDQNENENTTRMLESLFGSIKDHCWMYKNTWWLISFWGLNVCQTIDVIWGIYYYCSTLCYFIPIQSIVSTETSCLCCCQCLLSCVGCITCCSLGGIKAIGSSDTAEFASIFSNFMNSDGILDIAFSDLLASLHVTRLIHYQLECTIRDELIAKGLASSTIKEKAQHAVNAIEQLRGKVKEQLRKDGLNVSTLEGKVENALDKVADKFQQVLGLKEQTLNNNSNDEEDQQGLEEGKKNQIKSPEKNKASIEENALRSTKSNVMAKRQMIVTEARILEANQFLVPLVNEYLSFNNYDDRVILAQGARYLDFSTSIYDWSTKDKEPWWRRSVFRETYKQEIKSDHRGRALKAWPIDNVKEDDIVYANYKAGVKATPFAVVLDHAWATVVVNIRGTSSIDDWMSDLAFAPTELTRCSDKYKIDGKDRFAHLGILDSAEWITDDLLRTKVLDKLMLDDDAEYKQYKLLITGHSLGAGAGSLVALFLKFKFPEVKAIVFEPPGCTMNEKLAKESLEWCTSFVTGMDVITRFNQESSGELRNELLVNLARIRVPKHIIFESRNIDSQGVDAVTEFLEGALYPHDEIPETPFLDNVRTFWDWRAKKDRQKNRQNLYIPGKIVHLASESFSFSNSIVNKDEKKNNGDKSDFDLDKNQTCWATMDDFRSIVLSRHFISDHLTGTINAAFQRRMATMGLKQPYSEVLKHE